MKFKDMSSEEFERRYHFKPSKFVLGELNLEGLTGGHRYRGLSETRTYHCVVSRSGNNLIYEFCNKKLQDNVTTESFIFDIDGQLIYIDIGE